MGAHQKESGLRYIDKINKITHKLQIALSQDHFMTGLVVLLVQQTILILIYILKYAKFVIQGQNMTQLSMNALLKVVT